MRKDGQKTRLTWREAVEGGLKACSHCPGSDPIAGHAAPARPEPAGRYWEPEPEPVRVAPAARPAAAAHGGSQVPLWQIGSGKCYHWSNECRHMRKDGQKTRLTWREAVEGGLKACSHCPGSDPIAGHAAPGRSEPAGRYREPEPEPEPVRVAPASKPAAAAHGGWQPEVQLLQCGSGKKIHWSWDCQFVKAGNRSGTLRTLTPQELAAGGFEGPCSKCARAAGGVPSSLHRYV
jgi:hypothetical protein